MSDDLQLYESRYHGPFNHSIGKLLHIQQWTRPDITFSVTRLASFTKNPNKHAFLALEHLMHYLHTHSHEPIFYPRQRLGPEHPITYKFSQKQSSTYSLSSSYVYFVDSAFGNILPNRRSMQSNKGLLNGVIVAWSTNIQTSIAADSTDAELKSIYSAVKKVTSLRHFLTSSSIHDLLQQPTIIYADNQAAINIIEQNKISDRSRHLDIPVTFSHEKYEQQYFRLTHIDTKLKGLGADVERINVKWEG